MRKLFKYKSLYKLKGSEDVFSGRYTLTDRLQTEAVRLLTQRDATECWLFPSQSKNK